MLVVERSTGEAVGLVILFEFDSGESSGVDVRLGYMLAESAWGRGLASGTDRWFRRLVPVFGPDPITGRWRGELDNPASARVLEKNGFRPIEDPDDHPEGEQIFELRFGE